MDLIIARHRVYILVQVFYCLEAGTCQVQGGFGTKCIKCTKCIFLEVDLDRRVSWIVNWSVILQAYNFLIKIRILTNGGVGGMYSRGF